MSALINFCLQKFYQTAIKTKKLSPLEKVENRIFLSLQLKFRITRPEWAEALSPGQRPGLLRMIAYRPVRAKAL